MERRTFVKGLAAAVATAPLWPELARGVGDHLETLAQDLSATGDGPAAWRRVRQEFQLNPGLVHFNTGSVGAAPRVVTDAVGRYLAQLEGNPNVNTWGPLGSRMEVVRTAAAEFLGADLAEVAVTRNTTEGMNAVATGLDLEPGDEVLTTNQEHGGGMVCWQWLRRHRGIKVNYLEMPNPVTSKAQLLRLVEQHLTARTRVCSLMHIDTITGLQYPLAEIAAITRPKDILLVCDGAHAPGMLRVDVKALGVDTFASSSHKWLLAPKGSGLLYVRKGVQDRVHPVLLHDGYGVYSASSGTRDVPHILGHGVAIDFHNTLGRERIEARVRQLGARLRGHLEQIPRLRVLTPSAPELCGGIVTVAIDGLAAAVVHDRLYDEHDILVKVAQGTYAYVEGRKGESYNALRISTHIYNDEAEVDLLASLLADMLR